MPAPPLAPARSTPQRLCAVRRRPRLRSHPRVRPRPHANNFHCRRPQALDCGPSCCWATTSTRSCGRCALLRCPACLCCAALHFPAPALSCHVLPSVPSAVPPQQAMRGAESAGTGPSCCWATTSTRSSGRCVLLLCPACLCCAALHFPAPALSVLSCRLCNTVY